MRQPPSVGQRAGVALQQSVNMKQCFREPVNAVLNFSDR